MIGTIKKELLPTDFVPKNEGTIYNNRVAEAHVDWFKIGRIVFVSGTIKTNNALGSDWAILSGFPVAERNTQLPLAGYDTVNKSPASFVVNQYGSLVTASALAANTWYSVSGAYISA